MRWACTRSLQPLDNNGVVAELLLCRGEKLRKKGDPKPPCHGCRGCSPKSKECAAYVVQGLIHNSGDHDCAIADVNVAIQHYPPCANAYGARGRIYVAKGQMDRGLADLDEAIRLNAKLAQAYAARGVATPVSSRQRQGQCGLRGRE